MAVKKKLRLERRARVVFLLSGLFYICPLKSLCDLLYV